MDYVLALDPGTVETGVCVIRVSDYKPLFFGKLSNTEVIRKTLDWLFENVPDFPQKVEVAIEMVASYGMPVGAEVFETCVWIGRFTQVLEDYGMPVSRVFRKEEKLTLCQSPKANDATIRQALVDRFAYGVPNHGKGNKASPGWFYGFGADVWAAYAVGVTHIDR